MQPPRHLYFHRRDVKTISLLMEEAQKKITETNRKFFEERIKKIVNNTCASQ